MNTLTFFESNDSYFVGITDPVAKPIISVKISKVGVSKTTAFDIAKKIYLDYSSGLRKTKKNP